MYMFFPVCHCITIFGMILYEKGLITLEKRTETVPVLNTFFEYLNKSKNESETKLQFLQNVINQSGPYVGKNRSHDTKNVKEIYQHIISTTLFSSYGNINGYLAEIISKKRGNTYASLKKTVFQNLLQNYTSKDYCSPQRKSAKLTYLTASKIFTDHIWPIFREKKLGIFNAHRILRRSLPNDTFSVTSTESKDLIRSNEYFLSTLGERVYNEGVEAFVVFKEKGLSFIKENNLLKFFRLNVEYVNSIQIFETEENNSIDLWFSHTINRPFFVEYLKNLKEKEFYFNDITLLVDIQPDEIIPKKSSKFSLQTEVRYHMKFKSRYGLVDLAKFHHSFKNQYIVFPEITFFVNDAQYFNGKEILVLELHEKPIEKDVWMNIRDMEYHLIQNEKIESKRCEIIKNVAFDISLRTPLHRFRKSVDILKQYILKIDEETSRVPSYDMLAQDIYSAITIPEKYDEWKITNNIYINDVLCKSETYEVMDMKYATKRVSEIYNDTFEWKVEPVWKNYMLTPEVNNILFEDYYVLYSEINGEAEKFSNLQYPASVYKLALRQCDEEWIQSPITLYYAINMPIEIFRNFVTAKGVFISSKLLSPFHLTEEAALKNCASTKSSERLVLYSLEVKNQVGIVDVGRIFHKQDLPLYVTNVIKLKRDTIVHKIIEGRDVFVQILSVIETPKETAMVSLIKELNNLLMKMKK
ncbi:uncharacterized protein LOC122501524 [Leptopilina heterotoma]|uniref:uncharacterized protein LOC122501524 n=1 Tax=Leptopilina heterotoma TaxID=63436 RepID=UPI001CA7D59C|nr:uncharacterized protein LOC122501524 [Leptopilina heterotoma]